MLARPNDYYSLKFLVGWEIANWARFGVKVYGLCTLCHVELVLLSQWPMAPFTERGIISKEKYIYGRQPL